MGIRSYFSGKDAVDANAAKRRRTTAGAAGVALLALAGWGAYELFIDRDEEPTGRADTAPAAVAPTGSLDSIDDIIRPAPPILGAGADTDPASDATSTGEAAAGQPAGATGAAAGQPGAASGSVADTTAATAGAASPLPAAGADVYTQTVDRGETFRSIVDAVYLELYGRKATAEEVYVAEERNGYLRQTQLPETHRWSAEKQRAALASRTLPGYLQPLVRDGRNVNPHLLRTGETLDFGYLAQGSAAASPENGSEEVATNAVAADGSFSLALDSFPALWEAAGWRAENGIGSGYVRQERKIRADPGQTDVEAIVQSPQYQWQAAFGLA